MAFVGEPVSFSKRIDLSGRNCAPYPAAKPWHEVFGGKPLPIDDDVRSDLRQLHADAIGFLRTAILDGKDTDLAIAFLKEVPCPSPG